MNHQRKVLLLEEPGAAAADGRSLAAALQTQGAQVRALPLAPPYDELLDALGDGWLAVLLPSCQRARDPDPA